MYTFVCNLVVPTGIEPVTFTMSRYCSTTELRNYSLAPPIGIEPMITSSKPAVLPLHHGGTNWLRMWGSNPPNHWLTVRSLHLAWIFRNKLGFVSRTRTCDKGLKIAYAGCPPCFPKLPSHPLNALSYVQIVRPVPHFPDSQCLVLKPTRLLSNYHTSTLSHLLNATLPSSTL
jgi:hypothetical protein